MVFGFFSREKRMGRSLEKNTRLAEKAARMEDEDKLSESIFRQKERIKGSRRKRFQKSKTFAAIGGMRDAAISFQKLSSSQSSGKRRKKKRTFGPASEDLFFGNGKGNQGFF